MFSVFPSTTSLFSFATTALFAVVGVVRLPIDLALGGGSPEARGVSSLSPTDIAGFAPFTQFTKAAYCSGVKNWTCGGACSAVPGFQPTLTGGDGGSLPMFFVGYWSQQNAAIVSHEGTDPSKLLSYLVDLNVNQVQLSSTLFPGVPDEVMVHNGFRDAHSATAPRILAEVKRLISTKGATSVFVVGHSLGGAIAALDTLYLRLNLPSSVAVKGITYGTPRVGNPSWADWFNSKVNGNFQRVNNHMDPIPTVPWRGMGYSHVSGEIRIDRSGRWSPCTGNDNEEKGCTVADVPSVILSNLLDHLGPYEGILLGTPFCHG